MGLTRTIVLFAEWLIPGHVLYEMALGYELEVSKPDVSHLVNRCPPEVIEVRLHARPDPACDVE